MRWDSAPGRRHQGARTLVAFVCVAILAGMLAAILPARRASKLNGLEALQHE